ncbi:MAG: flavin-containing monooxygenase [Solirubrobacteraceae bacterium]
MSVTPHHRFAIVGSGFGGLGAAIKLKQEGIEDFVVLERAEDLGGTWRDNTYPGCACDIPSNLYSFSFAPNPDWSRTYSPQPEIWDYLRRVAREHDIDRYIRYRHEVTSARWETDVERWRIQTTGGELTADMLIAGTGPLSEPKLPDIEGIDSFQGTIFHSARWNHDHALEGERVAVIGTGASSIQIVPQIQPRVGRLHVFQRTPAWIVPRRDRPTTRRERLLFRAFPPAQRLMRATVYCMNELVVAPLMHPREGSLPERIARKHLREQVTDPELRRRLSPSYRIGCKRILISNDYYPALQRTNVELVTDPIRAITQHGILTADGTERELDTIILGTGFHVSDMPAAEWIHRGDGRTLAEVWRGSPQAYLGTVVAGFPNLFLLVGPNTGLGNNSLVFMVESQLHYLMDCLRFMDRAGQDVVEVREQVERSYNEEIQRRLQGSVWNSGGCASWYIDANGRNAAIWPGHTLRYRRRLRRFRPGDYELRPRSPVTAPPERPPPPRERPPMRQPSPAASLQPVEHSGSAWRSSLA